jgi:hypothetical protein
MTFRFFTVTTIVFYLKAAFKDPGFVQTNIFKAETENVSISLVHVNV